jgi:hypothetical protein
VLLLYIFNTSFVILAFFRWSTEKYVVLFILTCFEH